SFFYFFLLRYADHLHLHSFPTRRSSDLRGMWAELPFSYSRSAGRAFNCTAGGLRSSWPSSVSRRFWVSLNFPSKRGVGFVPWSRDRKSTRLNSSHVAISYAVFCLKKKKK